MASNNSNTLVDEKLAVSLFLDSLLRETEDVTDEAPALLVEPAPIEVVKPVVKIVTPEPIPDIEIKTEVKVEEQVVVAEKIETLQENAVSTGSIIPAWADEPFQILLFQVAGLKLAVPLVELCGVIQWNDSITEMPGAANFYMGILQHLDYKIAVIDTALMVLPANKLASLGTADPRERVNHIVLIDDYRWGLACDSIGEVITLNPEEVRWRTSTTTRSWLAGTVIEHMCALLNGDGFAAMLEKGQTNEDR